MTNDVPAGYRQNHLGGAARLALAKAVTERHQRDVAPAPAKRQVLDKYKAPFASLPNDTRCVYILDEANQCGDHRRAGSSYCEEHHQLTHIRPGSSREDVEIAAIENLAAAVGGRLSGAPLSGGYLSRLERLISSA